MGEYILAFIIGIAFVIIGILNRKGNISMIHSYHRKRISEADKLPFGKMTGLGMIILAVGIMLNALLSIINYFLESQVLYMIGMVFMGIGLVAGIAIIFYAIIKYNKGLF